MPAGASSGEVEFRFEPGEVRKLVADLRRLEGGQVISRGLRKSLRSGADPIKRQVQANASWSSRIPGAVGIGTTFSARRTSIFIRVNSKRAPHARAYENAGRAGTFRHPVFGKGWVSQPARPFFFAETAKHIGEVEQAAGKAVDEAARAAGFR